jgi:hypothetical protein
MLKEDRKFVAIKPRLYDRNAFEPKRGIGQRGDQIADAECD